MTYVSKVLSLVIPTYNRAIYLDKQIAWAIESTSSLDLPVEIVICDNASTDHTVVICDKWKKKIGDDEKIKFFRNTENVGLVKNCLLGIERATAEFVWLIGDDDPIDIAAVEKVVKVIAKHSGDTAMIHLNHRCVSGIDDSIIIPKFYAVDADGYAPNNGNSYISNLLEHHHTGGFMFITANVINRKKTLEFIKRHPPEEDTLLAYPMFLNVGLASTGGIYLISECLVDCVYHQSSWSDRFAHVYFYEVPKTLIKLHSLGISKRAISFCLNFQFKDIYSARDIIYKVRKNALYFTKPEFKSWLDKWAFKQKLRWQMLYQ